jgi:6-pyruvoyltetrahydropterin/6-carboxytetrahydropterin synthase
LDSRVYSLFLLLALRRAHIVTGPCYNLSAVSDSPLHQPIVTLARRVRFAINAPHASALSTPGTNGFAGNPPMRGLGRHYELVLTCRAPLNASQQYVRDIKAIDAAAHAHIIPVLEYAANSHDNPARADVPSPDRSSSHACVHTFIHALTQAIPPTNAQLADSLTSVEIFLTPTYSLMFTAANTASVTIRQHFDFAAAHRLHNPALTAAQNRDAFGKCNNPRGHGHNYRFEPSVQVPLALASTGEFSLPHLELICKAAIIDRFDHTHLNEDTAEFNIEAGGLIPTVENIAFVFHALLAARLASDFPKVTLTSMTVWETDRTSATYP